MSYSSYKTSFRGGRGSGYGSRGGYRGSRGEGGSWVSGGRSRGGSSFSSSSRGGGRYGSTWEKEGSSSYESRRYSGSGDYGGGGGGGSSERYSSRGGRGDEPSFSSSGVSSSSRRYSRQGSPLYGSREHNHRSSPEPSRKRMRTESSYQGSSIRRSHEDSFSSGNDFGNRSFGGFGSSEDKGGSYGERSRAYREDRERSRSNEYQFRKVMGPPSGPSRRMSPRGSFRGGRPFRGSRSSINFRGRGFKPRNDIFSRTKRHLMESSYAIRKKDYLRRLKLYKLKRLADRMRRTAKELGNKEDKKRAKESKLNGEDLDEDDMDDDEEDIEIEEEVETSVEEEEEEEELEEEGEEEDGEVDEEKEPEANGVKKEEELEEGETHEDGEVPAIKKKPKKKIVRKKVKKIVKKKIKKEKPTIKKKNKDTSNDNEESKEGVHDSETRAVNEEGRKNYLGRPFIRLECRHCNIRCVTFKEYSLHLHTTKHIASMRRLSLKLRQQLARMRIEQRREQRIIDEEHKDNPKLRTFFCSTCKLNHRSLKGQHIASAKHRKMREFLMPYCRVCYVTFRSPMGYENHLCELDHIKRASKMEYLAAKRKAAEKEDTGRNVDMDNFMILDSVGSPDESGEESGKEDDQKEKTGDDKSGENEEKKEKKKKKKAEIKLGLEFCKKVEVMYCDLCNIYLPRNQPHDKIVPQHCRTRVHLERLIRVNKYKWKNRHGHSKSKDDSKDEKSSVKKEGGEKHENKDGNKSAGSELETTTSSPTKKNKETANSEVEEGDIDEKLWSEVDKDLGDLLREVGPEAKSSDEDEDHEEQGRYDRFKLSEKDAVKKEVKDEDDVKQTSNKKSETLIKEDVKKEEVEEEEDDEVEEEEDDEEEEDEESKEEKSET